MGEDLSRVGTRNSIVGRRGRRLMNGSLAGWLAWVGNERGNEREWEKPGTDSDGIRSGVHESWEDVVGDEPRERIDE
jgi:hypothetical protein